MTATPDVDRAAVVRAELASASAAFHALLAQLDESNLRRPSHNPGWTNGEILTHMTFGFLVTVTLLPLVRLWGRLPRESSRPFAALLNAATGPFNLVNGLGARGQARIFTYRRLGRIFDWATTRLARQAATIGADEWRRGMTFPTRWDALFKEFMTVEDLFQYPIDHFRFHIQQIAR